MPGSFGVYAPRYGSIDEWPGVSTTPETAVHIARHTVHLMEESPLEEETYVRATAVADLLGKSTHPLPASRETWAAIRLYKGDKQC